MSRVLISTLTLGAVSLLSSTSVHSQPLNINPFPMQKAGTLSVQEPQIMTPEPVEVFAKEAEEEIKRLQAEKEALKAERERAEQVKLEAQERAEARRIEAEEKARALAEEKERLGAIERENAAIVAKREQELAAEQARLRAENEALTVQREQQLALERERINAVEAQAKAEAEQLKREKDALAVALAERDQQDAIAQNAQADEVLRLKQENEELAAALAKRKQVQADIEAKQMATAEQVRIERQQAAEAAALERENAALAQKLADVKAQDVVHSDTHAEMQKSGVDPMFESAALADNPLGMTPMIMESKPLNPSDVIEVRASDLGLVEPQVTVLDDPQANQDGQKVFPQAGSRQINLETAMIQVLPYVGQADTSPRDYAPVKTAYRSANAGESLEDVLRSWSQAEGVGFLWKTTQRFGVLSPLSADGDYASSVQALLDQHSSGDVRPIGKLDVDPVTGMRTLSILTE